MNIIEINTENVSDAGFIHSVSWQESHRGFCTKEFVELHTPEHQTKYLTDKMQNGTKVWMLTDGGNKGIVSVTDGLIEDLYVLPSEQGKGYGRALLDFAVLQAGDAPSLWILENNKRAEKWYREYGFYPTGRVNEITDKLSEIEFALTLDIRRTELTIPGMNGSVKLLHISDSHLCVTDSETDEKEAEYINQREYFWNAGKVGFARYFGDRCNKYNTTLTTADAFSKLIEYSKTIHADTVLSTGDLMECMHGAGEQYIKKSIADISFFATPGNHEEAVCEGIWREDIQVKDYDCFRIVAIDDRKQTFTDKALDGFEKLCQDGKPIILMMHEPLMTDLNRTSILGKREEYYTIDENRCDEKCKRFYEILYRTEAVKLILCGHIHGYSDTYPIENIRQITAPQGMTCGCHIVTVHG